MGEDAGPIWVRLSGTGEVGYLDDERHVTTILGVDGRKLGPGGLPEAVVTGQATRLGTCPAGGGHDLMGRVRQLRLEAFHYLMETSFALTLAVAERGGAVLRLSRLDEPIARRSLPPAELSELTHELSLTRACDLAGTYHDEGGATVAQLGSWQLLYTDGELCQGAWGEGCWPAQLASICRVMAWHGVPMLWQAGMMRL